MGDDSSVSRIVDYSFIETRSLMRARVRTVALLVGLYVASDLVMHNMADQDPDAMNTGPLLGYLAIAILSLFVTFGFLRTVVLGERREAGPLKLLKEGKRFVLRVYGFYAVAVVALCIPAIPIYIFLMEVLKFSEKSAMKVMMFVLVILFSRALIFGPLMIVRHDCSIFAAVRKLRSVRHKEMLHLIALLCVSWGLHVIVPDALVSGNILFSALLGIVYALIRIAIHLGGLRVLLYKEEMD